jgi:hypothetical protein
MFFIAAVLMAATGYGLLKLHRWSRRGAIALAAWIIAAAVPGTSSAVLTLSPRGALREGAIIVASVMAIRYLIDAPVRAAFDSTRLDS